MEAAYLSTWMAGLAASSRNACIESQTRRPYPRLHPPPSIAPLCGGEPTCEQVYGNSQCGWRRLKGAGRAGLTGGAAAVATAVAHLSLGAGRAGRARRPYPRLSPPPAIAPLCGGEPTCEQVWRQRPMAEGCWEGRAHGWRRRRRRCCRESIIGRGEGRARYSHGTEER